MSNHHHDSAGNPAKHHSHGHSHAIAANADRRYLVIALALIVGFMIVEVIVAILSGSLALLSDAGHMLTDAGAIAASLWAINLAARPARGIWTFGFKRAEILSAAANGITLLVISALVAVEAIHRLLDPPPVEGGPVLIVAIFGIIVNLVAVWVLAKANRSSLNVEGSFQHILTDLYGFIATAVAGLVVLTAGFTRADAIASLIVVALMLHAAWGLLRDSGRILLEGAPEGVDLDQVREHLLETGHVRDVHDLHVWTVTSDLPALSAHVVLDESCFHDGHAPLILDQLQSCLTGHFDVEHSTFQLEPAGHAVHETGTH
ncbi:cation diffusion facilitator family transporter [Arthrobacter bambusae]|uniref:cation diffusion facilitator family transporter n=1 Tax=Arthrobacter bambusae TaxID=1338426 RepID=UPI00277F92B1|nr:cation diffusion facilitator family transporter [Arthrobacter bambusae]MDQ0240121.1 cobalt-zinc-cadmium efflux system protein [Arthrobacter bambusae]